MGASYNKYFELKKKYGLTDSFVARSAEIPKSTFTDWKNGRSSPKIDKLQRIAMLFGVTVDYFLYDDMNTSADPDQTSAQPAYYNDPETAKVAQAVFNDPNLRLLFDAAEDCSPDQVLLAAEMLKKFKEGR